MGWGFDIFEKFPVKFPAHGQIIPVKCNQISHPGLHIAVKCCGIAFDLTFTYVQVSGIFYSSETILSPITALY